MQARHGNALFLHTHYTLCLLDHLQLKAGDLTGRCRRATATATTEMSMDALGLGFSYEEIFEMCQRVTKMDSVDTARSTGSALSSDRLDGDENPLSRRRRINFRKHVSEQSTSHSLSGEKTWQPGNVKIVGGGSFC